MRGVSSLYRPSAGPAPRPRYTRGTHPPAPCGVGRPGRTPGRAGRAGRRTGAVTGRRWRPRSCARASGGRPLRSAPDAIASAPSVWRSSWGCRPGTPMTAAIRSARAVPVRWASRSSTRNRGGGNRASFVVPLGAPGLPPATRTASAIDAPGGGGRPGPPKRGDLAAPHRCERGTTPRGGTKRRPRGARSSYGWRRRSRSGASMPPSARTAAAMSARSARGWAGSCPTGRG